MKKILGLDLGTNSIGWAVIQKGNTKSQNKILGMGVRIIPMDNEDKKYETGESVTRNAERRRKRQARRLNHRYKLRRKHLVKELIEMKLLSPDDLHNDKLITLEKTGSRDKNHIYYLRDKALKEKLESHELGRVLYNLNQRRGYRSSRKPVFEEDIEDNKEKPSDYLERIESLDEQIIKSGLTPGAFFYKELKSDPNYRVRRKIVKRERYIYEFDRIWNKQKQYTIFKDVLTEEKYEIIRNRIIYYQRRLRSQKHLVKNCPFESKYKAAPISSPLFQIFRMLQKVNDVVLTFKDGLKRTLKDDEREIVLEYLDENASLTQTQLKSLLKIKKNDCTVNIDPIPGNVTKAKFLKAFSELGIERSDLLEFDLKNDMTEEPYYKLWHLIYSSEDNDRADFIKLINNLITKFNFTEEEAIYLVKNVAFKPEYASFSSKAMKNIIPHLEEGYNYYDASIRAGYDPIETELRDIVDDNGFLKLLKTHSLRNPVVEQILNHMINIVNRIIASPKYGRPDEIRVELARELKMNIDKRKEVFLSNNKRQRENKKIADKVKELFKKKYASRSDIERYKLWEETGRISLYTNNPISANQLINEQVEIDHIIPRSRYFDDSFNNKVLVEAEENDKKSNSTAFDYMNSKGEAQFNSYLENVNNLKNKISPVKHKYLLMKGSEIPDDFLDRDIRATQYISRYAMQILKHVCPKVNGSAGKITAFLRYRWGVDDVLRELNKPFYEEADLLEERETDNGKSEYIKEWSKRNDHRSHAADALITAFTSQKIITDINTLNSNNISLKSSFKGSGKHAPPLVNFTSSVKSHLERILVSFKNSNSVTTNKVNKIKSNAEVIRQQTQVPRGSLHKDTNYGKIIPPSSLKNLLRAADQIKEAGLKRKVKKLLKENDGNINKTIEYIKENAIDLESKERVVLRRQIDKNFGKADAEKIVDPVVRSKVINRLNDFNNKPNEAFADLENDPVWFNEEKKIPIKSVRVFENVNPEPLHTGPEGKIMDYVMLRNNHHIAIYEKSDGTLSEGPGPVTFWEAVMRKLNGIPIIDKKYKDGWKFVTSLSTNDMFVINIDPEETDIFNPDNYSIVSRNLYRVQNISSKDYSFRLHSESTLDRKSSPFKIRLQSLSKWKNLHITKVHINHLGEIEPVKE